jgi:hypothetical protein
MNKISNILLSSRIKKFSDNEFLNKKDNELMKIIQRNKPKKLGDGYYGSVYLLELQDKEINYLAIKKNKLYNITFDNDIIKNPEYLEKEAGQLINNILLNKNSPHFIFNYTTTDDYKYNFNEYIKSQTLRDFLKKKPSITDFELSVLLFQIISALYTMSKKYNMYHYDLHFNNILIQKITKPNSESIDKSGHFIYKIDEYTFYIPNIGYRIYINDYGFSTIPFKMRPSPLRFKIQDESYFNTKSSRLYDFFTVSWEMRKYFKKFYKVFINFFPYTNNWPNDLNNFISLKNDIPIDNLKEILLFFFTEKYISNCQSNKWQCFTKKINSQIHEIYSI